MDAFEVGRVSVQDEVEPLESSFGPNEIDFDDDREEDQLPLDVVEAREAGVLLDDPEKMELTG